MNEYLVVKILDSQSISLPSTLVYGSVELRSYISDSETEISALKESAIINKFDFEKHRYSARIATIVKARDTYEATDTAQNFFSEVLDLKSIEIAISNFKTSEIGFVKDLTSGEISPTISNELPASMAFMMHQGDIQVLDNVNRILSLNNELSVRYRRSLHWVRNSKHESNKQLKTLFYWFAIEALVKESETDHVGPIIRWFLGFPNGKNRNYLPEQLINALVDHPRYQHWNNELIKIIEKIRTFRNESVHSGFRKVDFSKDELKLYSRVMVLCTSRCQAAVQYALLSGINTVSEFKEYIGIVFEDLNSINDIHGNIIHSLDNI